MLHRDILPIRIIAGRPFLFLSIATGLLVWVALHYTPLHPLTRTISAWDTGSLLLLILYAVMFCRHDGQSMEEDAERQQAGKWSIFWITLVGAVISFATIIGEFSVLKDAQPLARELRVGLVGSTLALSWLVMHILFAVRYAHEYYDHQPNRISVNGGLEFPGGEHPDYWDFAYFAIVIGMTFQVSDVQITSKKLRRLATAHGLLGFLFNTVILALTVNLVAGLL
jgi:uncharacterized membrane protein